MANNPNTLQSILDRLKAGKRLSEQDLKIWEEAMRSEQVTIVIGDRAAAIGGSADGAVIIIGDQNTVINEDNKEVVSILKNILRLIEESSLTTSTEKPSRNKKIISKTTETVTWLKQVLRRSLSLLQNKYCITLMTSLGIFTISVIASKYYIECPLLENKGENKGLVRIEELVRAGRRFQRLRFIVPFSTVELRIKKELQQNMIMIIFTKDSLETPPNAATPPRAIRSFDVSQGAIQSFDVSQKGDIIISDHLGKASYRQLKSDQQGLNLDESSDFDFIDENFAIDAIRFTHNDSNTLIALAKQKANREKKLVVYNLGLKGAISCSVNNYEPPTIALDRLNESVGIIESHQMYKILILKPTDNADKGCNSYLLPPQKGYLADIEFLPREDTKDPLILASAGKESLTFWNVTSTESAQNPLEITVEWREDSSVIDRDDHREISNVSKLSFSPDRRFLVTVQEQDKEQDIRLWEINVSVSQAKPRIEITEIAEITGDKGSTNFGEIVSIDINDIQGQRLLALGTKNGDIFLGSLDDLACLRVCSELSKIVDTEQSVNAEQSVNVLKFYREGNVLVSGDSNGNIKLLDLSILSSSFDELLDKACETLKEKSRPSNDICSP